jgi:hypothetical protein
MMGFDSPQAHMTIADGHVDEIEVGRRVLSLSTRCEGTITRILPPNDPRFQEETLYVIGWDNGKESVQEKQDLGKVELLDQ